MQTSDEIFHIPAPCDKLKSRGPKVRSEYCSSCDREIINLSALTRAEATALMLNEPLHCGSYWVDEEGAPVFADELLVEGEMARLSLMGRSLWRHAQVLSLPMLLAACEPSQKVDECVNATAIAVREPAAELELKQGAAKAAEAPSKVAPPDTKVLSAPVSYNDETKPVSRVTFNSALNDLELYQEDRNRRTNMGGAAMKSRRAARQVVGRMAVGSR